MHADLGGAVVLGTWPAWGYQIQIKGGLHIQDWQTKNLNDSAATSYVLDGTIGFGFISSGISYSLRIAAVTTSDGDFDSRASAWVTVSCTPTGPPHKVLGLTVTAGDAKLDLSWTAPVGTVTGYEVQHKLSSAMDWPSDDTDVTGTTHELTNLMGGSGYDVRVRAVNSFGAGAWSDEQSGTPTTPLPVPTNVTLTPIAYNGAPALLFAEKSPNAAKYAVRPQIKLKTTAAWPARSDSGNFRPAPWGIT